LPRGFEEARLEVTPRGSKTIPPPMPDSQVHPIARSKLPSRPTVHTNQLSFSPEVPLGPIVGATLPLPENSTLCRVTLLAPQALKKHGFEVARQEVQKRDGLSAPVTWKRHDFHSWRKNPPLSRFCIGARTILVPKPLTQSPGLNQARAPTAIPPNAGQPASPHSWGPNQPDCGLVGLRKTPNTSAAAKARFTP
jgi:hypothetical protein